MMTNGRLRFPASATLEPKITGKSGSTHGARIVRTPAMNEMMRNVMGIFYYRLASDVKDALHAGGDKETDEIGRI